MSKQKDQVNIGPPIAPGVRAVARRRGDDITIGTFAEFKEGKPIAEGSEIMHVGAPDDEGWCDVDSLYRHGGEARATSDGPPQVATPAYREGYDRIFGKKPAVGLA